MNYWHLQLHPGEFDNWNVKEMEQILKKGLIQEYIQKNTLFKTSIEEYVEFFKLVIGLPIKFSTFKISSITLLFNR